MEPSWALYLEIFCQKAESRRLSANLSKKERFEPETNATNERNASTFYPTKKIGRDSTSKLGERLFRLHPNLEEILSFISKENQ